MGLTYQNSLSSTGTNTLTQAAAGGVTWNLTFLEVSFAGPSKGPNARLTIYDGSTSGTVIYRAFLDQPTGSVGMVQKINLPVDANGELGIQATTGNAMTIVVDGFGANQSSINARFTDGLP
jgi:hypothetical protein